MELQLWVSTCLSENPGPAERCSLKPCGVSPSPLPGHQGWCLGECPSSSGGATQSVLATVSKAEAPEPALAGLSRRTAGLLTAGSAASPAAERSLRPCGAMGPAVTPRQQGPGVVSQYLVPDLGSQTEKTNRCLTTVDIRCLFYSSFHNPFLFSLLFFFSLTLL